MFNFKTRSSRTQNFNKLLERQEKQRNKTKHHKQTKKTEKEKNKCIRQNVQRKIATLTEKKQKTKKQTK